MNHNVHSCIKGCLTLKFSGSWKTVILSPLVVIESDGTEFSSIELSGPLEDALPLEADKVSAMTSRVLEM